MAANIPAPVPPPAAAPWQPPGWTPPDYASFPGAALGVANAYGTAAADRIRSMYGNYMSGVQGAVGALTNQYAGELGGVAKQIPGIYKPAIGTIRGISEGVRSRLTGVGQETAGREAAVLAANRLPTDAAGPDVPLAKEGAGAGQAAGAIGQAQVNALTAKQKADTGYFSKLPSFAKAEGQQLIASTLSDLSVQMAKQIASSAGEAAGIYWTIFSNLMDRANQDRDFYTQVRQEAIRQHERAQDIAREQNRYKAGIVGSQAPTVQGRVSYWQKVAEDRTAQTGTVYRGTSTGIRPVIDPRTGKQKVTLQREAAEASNIVAGQKALTAQQREDQRHQETLQRLQIAQQNADTTAARAAIAAQTAAETKRHNRWVETHPKPSKPPKPPKPAAPTGNMPRRNANGVWTTASGRKLSPKGQRYWENRYQNGLTDGRGGPGPVQTRKTGGGGGLLHPKGA